MSILLGHFLATLLKNRDSAVFKEYLGYSEEDGGHRWRSVSRIQLLSDVERSCAYWTRKLIVNRVRPGRKSFVGLWIKGTEYANLVHILGLLRANYIPQIFSSEHTPYLKELLFNENTRAVAFLYDPSFRSTRMKEKLGIPCLSIPLLKKFPDVHAPLPRLKVDIGPTDDAFAFHVWDSASSSYKVEVKPYSCNESAVIIENENLSYNISSFSDVDLCNLMIASITHNCCLIQTSKIDFGASEFIAMVKNEGLNTIITSSENLISSIIGVAKTDIDISEVLRGDFTIVYTGPELDSANVDWLSSNNVRVLRQI